MIQSSLLSTVSEESRESGNDDAEGDIVIVGGGFAVAALVRRLQHHLPRNEPLLIINEESYTTFNPLLPEVVGASIFPEAASRPLARRSCQIR